MCIYKLFVVGVEIWNVETQRPWAVASSLCSDATKGLRVSTVLYRRHGPIGCACAVRRRLVTSESWIGCNGY